MEDENEDEELDEMMLNWDVVLVGTPFFNPLRPALNYRQGQFQPAGLTNGATEPGRRSGVDRMNQRILSLYCLNNPYSNAE